MYCIENIDSLISLLVDLSYILLKFSLSSVCTKVG